jgi:hypothetical protein
LFCAFSDFFTGIQFWPFTHFLREFLKDVAKNFGNFGDNRRSAFLKAHSEAGLFLLRAGLLRFVCVEKDEKAREP